LGETRFFAGVPDGDSGSERGAQHGTMPIVHVSFRNGFVAARGLVEVAEFHRS